MTATCVARAWLETDDGDPTGPVCGKPATHINCAIYRDAPACEEHKCRCTGKRSPSETLEDRVLRLARELHSERASHAQTRAQRDEARAELTEFQSLVMPVLHCPGCRHLYDSTIVIHRHSVSGCDECLHGPELSVIAAAAKEKARS